MVVAVETNGSINTRSEFGPPGRMHDFHVNGSGPTLIRKTEGGNLLFIPFREPSQFNRSGAIARRDELSVGTASLLQSFERVFGGAYAGGSSPKSSIELAINVTADHGVDKGGKAMWTIHKSIASDGEHFHLTRQTAAYNGYDEITEVTFLSSPQEPFVTFSSHLEHRENHGQERPKEKIDQVSFGTNTYGSLERATQLLNDFAEIAALPREKVSFNSLASRADVLSQGEIKGRTKEYVDALTRKVEGELMVANANGELQVTTTKEGRKSRVSKPKKISRAELIKEAEWMDLFLGSSTEPNLRHLSWTDVMQEAESRALVGGTIFERISSGKTFADLEGERNISLAYAKKATERANARRASAQTEAEVQTPRRRDVLVSVPSTPQEATPPRNSKWTHHVEKWGIYLGDTGTRVGEVPATTTARAAREKVTRILPKHIY